MAELALPNGILDQVGALFDGASVRGPRHVPSMQAQIDNETFADEELA